MKIFAVHVWQRLSAKIQCISISTHLIYTCTYANFFLYYMYIGVINHLFSVWYVAEVCLRMHAYGVKNFFARRLALGITLFTVSCVHATEWVTQ